MVLISETNFNIFEAVIKLNEHIVNEMEQPQRFVDYAIGLFPQSATKNAVKKLIRKGELYVNGTVATTGYWVKLNDHIELFDVQHAIPKAYPLAVEVIFEDEYLAVVLKPPGIVTSGNLHRTLEHALIDQLEKSSQEDALKWAKPVHRLDAATSGLMLFSKTMSAHRHIALQFESNGIQKNYRAIVVGKPLDQSISLPIENLPSQSALKVLRSAPSLRNEELTLVDLFPKTGRTHQLRIHCASIGHPIVGDKLYGEKDNTMTHKGLFLSAVGIRFKHPSTEEWMEFKMNQPHKFEALLQRERRRFENYDK